jgi:hypothetical protein
MDENHCATVPSEKVRINGMNKLNDNNAATPDYVASGAESYRLQRSNDLRRLLGHITATILLAIALAIAAWLLLQRPTAHQDSSPLRVRVATGGEHSKLIEDNGIWRGETSAVTAIFIPADRLSRAAT